MKNIKLILASFFLIAFLGCEEDERGTQFVDNADAPSEIVLDFRTTQDNSGLVTITPTAIGATKFDIAFGDAANTSVELLPGESVDNVFEEGTYTVVALATAVNGKTTQIEQELVVSFQAPQNLMVTIENDPAISKRVNVTATAEFAMSYEVDFGESGSEPMVANIGDTVSYNYLEAGTYTITVEAMGSAIETTTYTQVDFEVTEILAPIVSASTPPSRNEEDVISIFSDAYTDIPNTDFFPNWGQSTLYTPFDLNGDAMIQYSNLNYQGIDIGAAVDATGMEMLHIDIWTPDATTIDIYPLPNGVLPADEKFVTKTLVPNEWNSFDIPMEDFTNQGLPVNDLLQFKFVGTGTVFIDNLYFYKESTAPFDDGLLTNGNFENGSDSWIVGVDDNSPAPVTTDAGNTYYSVDVTAAGNPYDVNLSQKLEIIQDETYTLTFDAWSNVNRSILAGIGLSGGDFSNTNETVNITPTINTYTLTLSATGFGALDARVLFDVGAEIGIVNIDNVSLTLVVDNLLVNGDFENGSDSWIVGVDDNNPAPVTTDAGNTYYSVDVTTAGNSFDVNLSQKLEIVQDETYTLTFDAWSDVNRSILAGIGLSGGDFSNTNETVNITPTINTYTLTLSATGFGALDARVLFDLGAEIGVVNIDNVVLSIN
ncbi:carbohydrate binding domain-containing protein [Winogradskyella forsetii]|uniref:carbohydrate binding domain-containing protein n=1 Tax=Winogradskyella forsetii TaxID=2686077 RepID=UPI001E5FB24F|nr:carbohydrate binding domain-containing protein [Winogradskyella forsetii]